MPGVKPTCYDVGKDLKEVLTRADKINQERYEAFSGEMSSLKLHQDAVLKTKKIIRDCKRLKELHEIPHVDMKLYLPEGKKDESAAPETVGDHIASEREEKCIMTFRTSKCSKNQPSYQEFKTIKKLQLHQINMNILQLPSSQVKVSDYHNTAKCNEKPVGSRGTSILISATSSSNPSVVTNYSYVKSESVSTKISPALKVGYKRKSVSSNEGNKRRKIEMSCATAGSEQLRWPFPIKYSKAVPAVIVPTLKWKFKVPKEKLILEEIKKKEIRANENMKRLVAERKMKFAQIKKLREERIMKAKEKRIQLEKEKLTNLEAKHLLIRTKAAELKETGAKTRPQKLVERHFMKTNVLNATSKQNEARLLHSPNSVFKTHARRRSSEYENYDLTPMQDSFAGNFGDSGDESNEKINRIPLWAQGIHLKSFLVNQFYYCIDTDELFGEVDALDLTAVFAVKRDHYLKRTRSTVWLSNPLQKSKIII